MTTKSIKCYQIPAEQKVAIVKEHLVKKKSVSELCEQYDISASLFYTWQQALFDNGASCLEIKRGPKPRTNESQRVRELEQQLKVTESKASPKTKLQGKEQAVLQAREEKLSEARQNRKQMRCQQGPDIERGQLVEKA